MSLDSRVTVRCDSTDKEKWSQAAKLDGRDLNGWVRKVLNAAVKKASRG